MNDVPVRRRADPLRTLIVKIAAIGDVCMALSAVAEFKRRVNSEIHWICGSAAAEIVERSGVADRLITVSETRLFRGSGFEQASEVLSVWRRVLGLTYDLSAVLHYDLRYCVLVLPVSARCTVRLSRQRRATSLIAGRHHSDEYLRILLGTDADTTDRVGAYHLGLPRKEVSLVTRPRVVLVPGGAKNVLRDDSLRRWPLDRYASLAERLSAFGLEVVLVGASGDSWVRPAFSGMDVRDLIGATSLLGVLTLLDGSDLVVTHDTGILHLSALTSVPVVALFGPTNPAEKLPHRDNVVALWGGATLACRPCYDGRDYAKCGVNRCMLDISVDEVTTTVLGLLHGSCQLRRGIPVRGSGAAVVSSDGLPPIPSA